MSPSTIISWWGRTSTVKAEPDGVTRYTPHKHRHRTTSWPFLHPPVPFTPGRKAGIENHQLDTVDFFLKSKENLLNLSSKSSVPDQLDDFPSHLYLRSKWKKLLHLYLSFYLFSHFHIIAVLSDD